MNPSLTAALATFPGARPVEDVVDAAVAVLAPYDFLADTTLAMVSSCRDELTFPLPRAVADRLGLYFNLGGLGGVPTLGRTGWQAALSHVPDVGGRGHVVVAGMTHIGFGPDGTPGHSLRQHQDHTTATCGALMSILQSTDRGDQIPDDAVLADYERQQLHRLLAQIDPTPAADIVELTRRAAIAVETQMWSDLDALEVWREIDVAVFCGIQIHVHDAPDHLAITSALLQRSDGTREPIDL